MAPRLKLGRSTRQAHAPSVQEAHECTYPSPTCCHAEAARISMPAAATERKPLSDLKQLPFGRPSQANTLSARAKEEARKKLHATVRRSSGGGRGASLNAASLFVPTGNAAAARVSAMRWLVKEEEKAAVRVRVNSDSPPKPKGARIEEEEQDADIQDRHVSITPRRRSNSLGTAAAPLFTAKRLRSLPTRNRRTSAPPSIEPGQNDNGALPGPGRSGGAPDGATRAARPSFGRPESSHESCEPPAAAAEAEAVAPPPSRASSLLRLSRIASFSSAARREEAPSALLRQMSSMQEELRMQREQQEAQQLQAGCPPAAPAPAPTAPTAPAPNAPAPTASLIGVGQV